MKDMKKIVNYENMSPSELIKVLESGEFDNADITCIGLVDKILKKANQSELKIINDYFDKVTLEISGKQKHTFDERRSIQKEVAKDALMFIGESLEELLEINHGGLFQASLISTTLFVPVLFARFHRMGIKDESAVRNFKAALMMEFSSRLDEVLELNDEQVN